MKTYRPITGAIAALFVVAVLGWPSAGQAAASTATTFSGRATVVQGSVAGIGVGPIVDTGPVSAGGGHLEASVRGPRLAHLGAQRLRQPRAGDRLRLLPPAVT